MSEPSATECVVCFRDLRVTREPWHAVTTESGLVFAHDAHSPADIAEGVSLSEE